MNFVNNINFVFTSNRWIFYFFSKFSNFINPIITCGINFQNIYVCAICYAFTNFTFVTRISIVRMWTINRFCKNFGYTSFARSPSSRKQISMPNLVILNLISKRCNDMFLSNNFIKILRPIFSI